MANRRLHHEQPDAFAFSDDNQAWAEAQIGKYPEDRAASAVIPLLWRAQEQEGWVTEPAIRAVADMLDMPYIRVLEVATFYTMFQLAPVGKKAHIQVCGTTPCRLRGAEDVIKICKKRIAEHPHTLSDDGDFSWEEVECLGACVNAPMVEIFSDTYEDLTDDTFNKLLDGFAQGSPPNPGPQNGRHYSVPEGGATTLQDPTLYDGSRVEAVPAGLAAARIALKDRQENSDEDAAPITEKQITEKPAAATDKTKSDKPEKSDDTAKSASASAQAAGKSDDDDAGDQASAKGGKSASAKPSEKEADAGSDQKSLFEETSAEADEGAQDDGRPAGLAAPAGGIADDLKKISGIGPKIEGILNDLGIFHFRQIADWTEANKVWVDGYLKFKGRIDRENWISQAAVLAEGEDTSFSKRVDKGEVPSSQDEGEA